MKTTYFFVGVHTYVHPSTWLAFNIDCICLVYVDVYIFTYVYVVIHVLLLPTYVHVLYTICTYVRMYVCM